jgi:hypothetical protein
MIFPADNLSCRAATRFYIAELPQSSSTRQESEQTSQNQLQNRKQKTREVLERAKGIEPSYAAWEAAVLPLNYARKSRVS